MYNLVLAAHILVAIALIGLVLIQHGKGADAGASFGAGGAGTVFGAAGSANFLTRSTAVLAGVFFITSLALAHHARKVAADKMRLVPESQISTPMPNHANPSSAPSMPMPNTPASSGGH